MSTKILSTITAAVLTAALTAPAEAQEPIINNSLGTAPVAPGATPVQFGPPVFAQELFGPNSEGVRLEMKRSNMGSWEPVEIRVSYPSGTLLSVDNEKSAVFTYRISGAVFAEDVSGGDLSFRAGAAPGTAIGGFTFAAGPDGGGGRKGDDFVSYTVTATADTNLSTTSLSYFFNFIVPDLEMVTVADGETLDDRRIILSVTIDPPAASRFGSTGNNFPKFPATLPSTDHMATIAFIDPAYMLTVSPAETATEEQLGQISLDDDTMLVATGSVALVREGRSLVQISGLGDSEVSGLRISDVSVEDTSTDLHTNHKIGDAETPFQAGTTDMLRVVASGNFSASDRLFLSTSTGNTLAYNENSDIPLTISADGTTAEGSAPLSGTGALTQGSSYNLYYAPGGSIRRGSIGSSYTLDFASATAKDAMTAAKDLMLEYSGIQFTNYAYAIPHPDAMDQGNLRIRCEGASPCTIFFRCRDEGGNDVGSFARTLVNAETTRRFSSMDLHDMIGGNWPRRQRLACSMHSSSRVAVQLLVRSGGTLTNNSFIGGLDASQ